MVHPVRAPRLALLAAMTLLLAAPLRGADEPSPQRKAELEATAARRKATRQNKADAKARKAQQAAQARAAQAEAARQAALSDPLLAMEARRQRLAAEIAEAEAYQRSSSGSGRSKSSPLADPVYLEQRRQEAVRLQTEFEREIRRQAELIQQARAGSSADPPDNSNLPSGAAMGRPQVAAPAQAQPAPAAQQPRPEAPRRQPASPPKTESHAAQRGR